MVLKYLRGLKGGTKAIIHGVHQPPKKVSYQLSKKSIIGTVVGTKMQKTAVVLVDTYHWNTKYKILVRHNTKLFVHDPFEQCDIGDIVEVKYAGKRFSKHKSHVIEKMIQKNPLIAGIMTDPNISEETKRKLLKFDEEELLRKGKQY